MTIASPPEPTTLKAIRGDGFAAFFAMMGLTGLATVLAMDIFFWAMGEPGVDTNWQARRYFSLTPVALPVWLLCLLAARLLAQRVLRLFRTGVAVSGLVTERFSNPEAGYGMRVEYAYQGTSYVLNAHTLRRVDKGALGQLTGVTVVLDPTRPKTALVAELFG